MLFKEPIIERRIKMSKRCKKWSRFEKELLREQMQFARVPWRKAKIPGRKKDGIRRQALRLGLKEKERHPPLSEGQQAKLRDLVLGGYPLRTISEFDMLGLPHRTVSSLRKHIGRLGLAGKNRSLAAKAKKIWLNGEKGRFLAFLEENSTLLAPQEIAQIFKVKKCTVVANQKALRVKTPLAETLAIPYFKQKLAESRRQRSRIMLLDFDNHIKQREKELDQLAEKMRGQKRLVPLLEKRCKVCKKTWPKHKKFFFFSVHRTKHGSSWHFWARCAICTSKIRHRKKVAHYEKKYSRKLE